MNTKLLVVFAALCFSNALALDGCSICKTVVQTVAGLLDEEESVIQAKVDGLCKRMGPVASICKSIVDKELPKIIEWLEQGHNEEIICQRIGLCSALEKIQPNGECSICKEVVEVVEGLLDKSEPEIEAIVDKEVCDKIPFVSSLCKALVKEYLPKMIAELKSGLSPDAVCSKIGLCSDKLVKQPPPPNDSCGTCKTIIGIVAGMIGSEEPVIEAEVDKVCDELGPLASICKSLVHQYLPEVITWLEDGKTADEICAEIGVCSALKQRPQPNDMCSTCKTVVGIVTQMIDAEEPVIEAEVDKVCDELGPLASYCKEIVHQYLPEIINWLKDGKSAEEICSTIGMCSSMKAPQIDECALCHVFVHAAYEMKDQPHDVIKRHLEELCKKVGHSEEKQCLMLVDKYLDKVLAAIKDGHNTEEICRHIGLCHQTVEHIMPRPQISECSICKDIVKVVDGALGLGEKAIEELVDKEVCDKIPFVASICKRLVNKYVPKIIDELKSGLSPDEVCGKIGLCSDFVYETIRLHNLETGQPNVDECALCLHIVQKAQEMQKAGASKADIQSALYEMCDHAGGDAANQCKATVKSSIDQLLAALKAGRTPDEVCVAAKLCQCNKKVKEQQLKRQNGECSICKEVVEVVEGLLDKSEPEIEAIVDKEVCDKIPFVSSLCKALVKEYLPKMIAELKSGLSPDAVCSKIGLCSDKLVKQPPPPNDSCGTCKTIIGIVAGMIGSEEPVIEAEVDKVCDELGPLASICKSLVHQYLPEVITWLEDGKTADEICAEIGVCSALKAHVIRQPKLRADGCSVCTMVAKVVSGLLHMEEPQIKAEVDKLCSKLGSFSSVCQMLADKELDNIIKWLQNGDNEKMICTKLGLCSAR